MSGIERITAACAYITSSNLNGMSVGGTGYLVDASRVATCAHVVERSVRETIRVRFEGFETSVSDLHVDHDNDCAVLELAAAPTAVEPLPLGGECIWKAPWDGYGYPGVGNGTGVTTSGIISNPHARDDLRVSVLELTSPEAAAGMATPLHGFSGSPVVVDGAVVGHIKRFLSDPDNEKRPAFGKVYAVKADCVSALLGRPAMGPRPAVDAPPPDSAPHASQVKKVLDLLERWSGRDMPHEKALLVVAESLIQLGEPQKALEVLNSPRCGLRDIQLRALALAKIPGGAQLGAAVTLLERLWATSKDAETGGLLAGRYKQQWKNSGNEADLRRCHQTYLAAFDRSGEFYPGINAAATALWLGDKALSRDLARRVLVVLRLVATPERDAWYHATEAEAHLLLEDVDAAKVCYRRAVHRCDHAPETVRTMQAQAEEDLRHLGRERDELGLVFVGP
jgi:hypothetical protein